MEDGIKVRGRWGEERKKDEIATTSKSEVSQ